MDSLNYINVNNPRARDVLLQTMDKYSLVDSFRHFNKNTKRYTWRRKNPQKHARLDYCITTANFLDKISTSEIISGYRTDHSICRIKIMLNKFKRGNGTWKLNASLLKDLDYLNKINNAIIEVTTEYALPVYNENFLKTNFNKDIQYTISESLFLEMLLLRIRGESISFSSYSKKKDRSEEQNIIEKINSLEKLEPTLSNVNELNCKKEELEMLREKTLKGHMIRSRALYFTECEKPTKYFCSLENKNYLDKTVKKINKPDGTIIVKQEEILDELANFYSNLFQNKDKDINFKSLKSVLSTIKHPTLSVSDSDLLEHPLNVQELGQALKKMKNNKSPGIDGFPSEFFKVFWPNLKYPILRALNHSFKNGILPYTLRKCLISCLPKGDKPREFLKNWRPISLLSVVYKIASSAIVNRIRISMDNLISHTQSGFLQNRFIGESTRVVYDIMHYLESNNKIRMLMLIDFEKAFDSISWNFLYRSMELFGFGKNIIKWVKLFNNDITAYVMQCGNLSRPIKIGRGCRQGDPISAYLFILCGEILSLMIKQNKYIKGIEIGGSEFKLTQFADDTTLLLDGSERSLQSFLNILEVFGSISGLKMNSDKTKIIWIGRKKFSKEKLNVNVNLNWGITNFTLLGLIFDVNLEKMISNNYVDAINKIEKLLLNWSRRDMTPLGKVTIVKTFVLSKLNHLFSSLPAQQPSIFKKLDDIIYRFIWNNKPDKIKRTQLCQDYLQGGLKMLKIDIYVTALKSVWIKRLLNSTNSPWVKLFSSLYCGIDTFAVLGPKFCRVLKSKNSNPFWKEVLDSWMQVSNSQKIDSLEKVLYSPIWYNSKIVPYDLYIKDWFNKGIIYVKDILNLNGSMMTQQQLQNFYKINITNFLEYHKVKIVIEKFLNKNLNNINFPVHTIYPAIPQHMNILYRYNASSQDFYKLLDQHDFQFPLKEKWDNILDATINLETWQIFLKACFKVVRDQSLIWFQYKLILRIIGTRSLLFKMKIHNSNLCRLCNSGQETIIHLFYHCTHTITLWNNIQNWIFDCIHQRLPMNIEMILLGYNITDARFTVFNTIYMVAKRYIFHCAYYGRLPNFLSFKQKLFLQYKEELMASKLSYKEHAFMKSWAIWKPIFNDLSDSTG